MNSIRFKNPNKASLNIIGVLRERHVKCYEIYAFLI